MTLTDEQGPYRSKSIPPLRKRIPKPFVPWLLFRMLVPAIVSTGPFFKNVGACLFALMCGGLVGTIIYEHGRWSPLILVGVPVGFALVLSGLMGIEWLVEKFERWRGDARWKLRVWEEQDD